MAKVLIHTVEGEIRQVWILSDENTVTQADDIIRDILSHAEMDFQDVDYEENDDASTWAIGVDELFTLMEATT